MCSYIFISGSEKLPGAFLQATSDTETRIGELKIPFNMLGRSSYSSTIQYTFLLVSISHLWIKTNNHCNLCDSMCVSKNNSFEPQIFTVPHFTAQYLLLKSVSHIVALVPCSFYWELVLRIYIFCRDHWAWGWEVKPTPFCIAVHCTEKVQITIVL